MCNALHDTESAAGGKLRAASASLSRILVATAPHHGTPARTSPDRVKPRAVLCYDSLGADAEALKGSFDIVVTNPPFNGNVDDDAPEARRRDALKTKKTELLFLDESMRSLRRGGRGCVLVPGGVLFGTSKAHLHVRRQLVEENNLLAVIHVPAGAFKPYAGSATSIVLFERQTGPTQTVWFDEITGLGYSLDNKRKPTGDDDVPDVLARWSARRETGGDRKGRGFFVGADELRENDYVLQLGRYQEVAFEPVEYGPPEKIMREILRINLEVEDAFRSLAGVMGMDVDEMMRSLRQEMGAADSEG
jgi:type I restriction enzyme M protein